MRVYLDNSCYNRPFDEQTQLKVRLETDRDPQDYTRWREANMYIGESVHDVAERARAAAARYQSLNTERV